MISKNNSGGTQRTAYIRVGPAGWSYPDWSSYAYPSRKPMGFNEVSYLAEFFDTIEINTSFYNPIRADHAKLRRPIRGDAWSDLSLVDALTRRMGNA